MVASPFAATSSSNRWTIRSRRFISALTSSLVSCRPTARATSSRARRAQAGEQVATAARQRVGPPQFRLQAKRAGEVEHDHAPLVGVEHVALVAVGVADELGEHVHDHALPREFLDAAARGARALVRSRSASSISTSSTHHDRAPRWPRVRPLHRGRHHLGQLEQPRQLPRRDVVAIRVHEPQFAGHLLALPEVVGRVLLVHPLERGVVGEGAVGQRQAQRAGGPLADRLGRRRSSRRSGTPAGASTEGDWRASVTAVAVVSTTARVAAAAKARSGFTNRETMRPAGGFRSTATV